MTTTSEALQKNLGLQYNPFPPATTGVASIDDVSLPPSWEQGLETRMDHLVGSVGEKALLIVGGYGSGKTFILNWLARKYLPPRRVQPYFFDNPGVAFYDLANRLMRQMGRYELSKAIWEMFYRPGDQQNIQPHLVQLQFPDWLATLKDRESRNAAVQMLSDAMRARELSTDEEIANKFARVVVETRERPYYEYRDFVPRTSGALVAEREEANYFRTLVRVLLNVIQGEGIALLIDEFEDVALGRRLNKKQTSEYMATMRHLLNTARDENLWVILSMTPEGLEQTTRLDPSLLDRFTQKYEIPPLTDEDAHHLVLERLTKAHTVGKSGLWPLPEEALTALKPTTLSSPRRLIKVLWQSIAFAVEREESAPITLSTLRQAEEALFPGSTAK